MTVAATPLGCIAVNRPRRTACTAVGHYRGAAGIFHSLTSSSHSRGDRHARLHAEAMVPVVDRPPRTREWSRLRWRHLMQQYVDAARGNANACDGARREAGLSHIDACRAQKRKGNEQRREDAVDADRFQIAAKRAAASFKSIDWLLLSPTERTAAVYRELRRLDAQSIKQSIRQAAPASDSSANRAARQPASHGGEAMPHRAAKSPGAPAHQRQRSAAVAAQPPVAGWPAHGLPHAGARTPILPAELPSAVSVRAPSI